MASLSLKISTICFRNRANLDATATCLFWVKVTIANHSRPWFRLWFSETFFVWYLRPWSRTANALGTATTVLQGFGA